MVQDKVALVTGASRGIGRSISLVLAAQGAKIVAVDVDLQATEDFVAELKASGAEAVAVQGNVTVTADVDNMVKVAKETFARIDILVNNAGITRDALLLRMKDEDWDAVLDVNLKGAFLCTRAVSKLMTKQRSGRIINIASVVGQMGNAGQANYCASKAGLMGLPCPKINDRNWQHKSRWQSWDLPMILQMWFFFWRPRIPVTLPDK